MRHDDHRLHVLCLVLLLIVVGCSGQPEPKPTGLNPSSATAQALAQYDTNQDGKLDGEELKACPSIASATERIDSDKDGSLTSDEITARMQQWLDCGTILMDAGTEITLDGQGLEGATVTFEPEAFMGDSYQSSTSVTDAGGQVSFRIEGGDFPGLPLGFYRVKVSKQVGGRETIPSKYNTETELGCEIADDISDRLLIQFDLQNR